MPLRSLIFSSDQESSHRLVEALHELDFQVDACCEIFAAVEKLTGHSYDLIITDWNDPVEAAFLLKTSRELKLNCNAFTVMVARKDLCAAAQQAGARMLLSKPLLPGQTKYALLTSVDFFNRVKTQLPVRVLESLAAPRVAPAPVEPRPQLVPRPQHPVLAAAAVAPASPRAVSIARKMPSPMPLPVPMAHNAVRPGIHLKPKPPAKRKPRYSHFLWVASVAASLSAGYILSGPVRNQAGFKSAERVLTQSLPGRVVQAASLPELATAVYHPRSDARSPQLIHVLPVDTLRRETVVPSSVPDNAHEQPASTTEPEMLPEASGQSIPASLRALPPDNKVPSVDPKTMNSPIGSTNPISLAEDIASNMLVQRVQPSYPEQAMKVGLEGSVVLQALIRKDGTVSNLKLISGPFLLGRAAYKAVKQWRYKPYLLNGEFVEAQTYVTVNFRLPSM